MIVTLKCYIDTDSILEINIQNSYTRDDAYLNIRQCTSLGMIVLSDKRCTEDDTLNSK